MNTMPLHNNRIIYFFLINFVSPTPFWRFQETERWQGCLSDYLTIVKCGQNHTTMVALCVFSHLKLNISSANELVVDFFKGGCSKFYNMNTSRTSYVNLYALISSSQSLVLKWKKRDLQSVVMQHLKLTFHPLDIKCDKLIFIHISAKV